MKENGSEVFYEILGKERGTKELYHAEDEKDLCGRAFFQLCWDLAAVQK